MSDCSNNIYHPLCLLFKHIGQVLTFASRAKSAVIGFSFLATLNGLVEYIMDGRPDRPVDKWVIGIIYLCQTLKHKQKLRYAVINTRLYFSI